MTANLSAMNLLLGTRNQHKTREFTQLLGPNFTLRDLTRTRDLPEIRENGRAFEDNAVIKAIAISKIFPHEMVIADDSGLEVDALNGAPGIFSARYGGKNASDLRNVEKLLRVKEPAQSRNLRGAKMDSVMIQSSFQKDLKRRSPNYRPKRKTRSVIARRRWPNWFGILILRAGQHESDRDANPRGCS